MTYEIVIKNGTLIDPKRGKSTIANLGIKSGKIAAITRENISGNRDIDASGKIVSPGFIDIHAHVEGNEACAKVLAAMGVTTVYNGNCGMGVIDLEGFFKKYKEEGFLIHQIEQKGHTLLREEIGLLDRYQPADDKQIEKMKALLEEAFQIGAYGLSFGLEYVPGSSNKEVLELSKVAARYDKLVSIHTRTDSYGGLFTLREALDITRKTGAKVNISHLVYQYGMGMLTEALLMIEEALRDGLDISVDSGLYSSFATAIGSAVFDDGCLEKWGCDYSSFIAGTGMYRGKRLSKEQFHFLREQFPEETCIAMVGKDYEVFEALEKPYMLVGTDAGTIYDNEVPGHPQDAGTYPKFIKTMVREQNRISLLEAIAKCTYLPAKRLGLDKKGILEVGADADIVIFDLNTIGDKADYPCFGATDARPEGIGWVLVNGEIAVEGKEVLHKKAGTVIRGKKALFSW